MGVRKFAVLSLLVMLTGRAIGVHAVDAAQASKESSKPMTKIELVALLAAGSSIGYLELLAKQRGIAFVPDDSYLRTPAWYLARAVVELFGYTVAGLPGEQFFVGKKKHLGGAKAMAEAETTTDTLRKPGVSGDTARRQTNSNGKALTS